MSWWIECRGSSVFGPQSIDGQLHFGNSEFGKILKNSKLFTFKLNAFEK